MAVSDNYLAWQNALITWAEAATGIRWAFKDAQQGHKSLGAYGLFDGPLDVEEVGQDYVLYNTAVPGQALPEVEGQRIMTVSARVVSRSQKAGQKAGVYLERARLALRLPATSDAWNAAGMALASTEAIRQFNAPGTNDRTESIAAMVLTLNVIPDALTGGADLGVMEHIKATGHIAPTDPMPDDELIPP